MQTVIGAFEDRQMAHRALERLVQAGFDRDDVHVQEGATDGTASTATTGTTTNGSGTRDDGRDRGMLESIGHFFGNLFGDDDRPSGRAGVYAEAVRRGTSVVVVDAEDDEHAETAANLLHELGAIDVDERAQQWRAQGWTGYEYGQNQPQAREGREGVMNVVQEELQVGKRTVDRGGVRVFHRVSEKPVRELVRLREERAVVERTPVDREATAGEMASFKEGSMEVREMSEEAVVGKRARVVEEVRVGKDVQEREEMIEDTVRRKDVEVERIEGEGTSIDERDRAVAADRDVDMPAGSRDPETPTSSKAGRKTIKKPTKKM